MDEKRFEDLLNSMAYDLPEPSPELVARTIDMAREMENSMIREEEAMFAAEAQPAAEMNAAGLPDRIPRKQPPPPRGVRPDRASRRAQQQAEKAMARDLQKTEEKTEEMSIEMASTDMSMTETAEISPEAREQAARASAEGQRVKIGLEELIRQEEEAQRQMAGPESSAAKTKSRAAQVEAYKQRRAAEKQSNQMQPPV